MVRESVTRAAVSVLHVLKTYALVSVNVDFRGVLKTFSMENENF